MVNSRDSLSKIPSTNHDGTPYILDLDIYKEGYWAYDISNYYKGRVDDNGTPFQVRWFEHGQIKNVQGLRPFIRGTVGQHTIDDEIDPDNPKVVPSPDCSQIYQIGETADTMPGGIAVYRMVNQCFTQEGMFYGEIGLKDSSDLVLSSVDIAFKVLGGRMNMLGARKFYVSEFEKALDNLNAIIEKTKKDFSQQLSQVITDARNTYNTQVKNSQDALVALNAQAQANRDEQANLSRHLTGMDEQIKNHDIITRPEYEEQNARIDKRLGEMKLSVETYPNLAEVTKAYPNGNTGLIITEDGYRAVWNGSEWEKGSAFVAPELGNKSVNPSTISSVSYKQVADNALDVNSIKPWWFPGPTYTVNADNTIDIANSSGDQGLLFKVDATSLNDDFYINLDLTPLKNDNQQTIDIYLISSTGKLGDELISMPASHKGQQRIKASKNKITNYLINGDFWLLVAIHQKDIVRVDLRVSNNEFPTNLSSVAKKANVPDFLTTSSLNAENWSLWNNTDGTLKNNSEGLYFKQNSLGDVGFYTTQKVNPQEDIYVTVTALNNPNYSIYLLKDFSQIALPGTELTYQYNGGSNDSANAYKTFAYKVPKSQLKVQDIMDEAIILFATHAKGAFMQIKDISVSNAPGSRSITKKIDQIYTQSGINVQTQVGNVSLIQNPVNSDKVHYIGSNDVCTQDNQLITQIDIVTKKPGTVNFAVGTIDQNSLLVNNTKYSYKVNNAGLNSIPVSIPLNSGQRLFLDISDGMTSLYGQTCVGDQSLIQDEKHMSQRPGYTGMIFYSIDYALPFQYFYGNQNTRDLVSENTKKIKDIEATTTDLTIKMNQISKGIDTRLILTDSKNIKYKLQIIDGKLTAQNMSPKNVVIIGNSLTYNTGEIGMNASDANHDYYHYVTEYIKSKNPDVKINPRTNVSPWEQADDNPPTAEREKVFNDTIKPLLSADTDLVIIQLGDNVNNDVRESTLPNDAKELIQEIKGISPKATIFWIYGWFGDQEKVDKPIKEACEAENVQGIDISDLNIKENQGTMGSTFTGLDGKTYTVDNPGVAAHPGDKGHKAIADRIISNFDF